MTITDILRTLARFRRLAIAVAILTLALGVFAAVSPSDRYRATSTIIVQPTISNGGATSVQVIDFLVPSFITRVETRSFQAEAADRLPAALRQTSVSLNVDPTAGTGILAVQASSTDPDIVAPWADAIAEELVATVENDFVELTIIDTALTPSSPYAPSRGVIVGVAAALSIVLAVLAALVASAVRGRGDRASELRDRFGAAVLGEIPSVRGSLALLSPDELVHRTDADHVVEALQTLRANLTIALSEREHPWVVVTSAHPSEGKSFIATSLAWLLASVNRPTILIDGDSRRPTDHSRLGQTTGVGLEGVGPDDLRHVLQSTSSPQLRFLGSGSPDRHPAEVASTRLPHVLRQAEASGDVVIIDTPPLPVAAETIVFASGVGAVILVIDSRRRDTAGVERVVTTLQDRDVHILGVVINRSRRRVRRGYYAQAGARPAAPAPAPLPREPGSVPADRLRPREPVSEPAAPPSPAPDEPDTEAPWQMAPRRVEDGGASDSPH